MTAHRPQALPYTVLCIEPDADWRRLILESLCEYTVIFAETGLDALRLIYSTSFHAYVTEYWLPDFSGIALCRDIRKADENVPVMFYTGYAQEKARASSLRAGAAAYLVKPTGARALVRQLTDLLDAALLRSVSAQTALKAATTNELRRQIGLAGIVGPSKHLSASFSERLARRRALEAFTKAGGCRAWFDSWWPQAFLGACATIQSHSPSSTR